MKKIDQNVVLVEEHACFIKTLNLYCAPHELGKSWSVEYQLMEEGYPDGTQKGGIDASHEVLLTPPNLLETEIE